MATTKARRLTQAERRAAQQAKREAEAKKEQRKKEASPALAARRAAAKARRANPDGSPRRCGGTNLLGEPCKSPPLKNGTVIDEIACSGDYCLKHEPRLPADAWERHFRSKGSAATEGPKVPRPLDELRRAFEQAPALLFESSFEALGLEWDPDEGVAKPKMVNGKRAKGATVIGFSREGVAKKSRYKDYALREKIQNSLADRLYGKPGPAPSVSQALHSAPKIPQTAERALTVANILRECGALVGQTAGADPDDE